MDEGAGNAIDDIVDLIEAGKLTEARELVELHADRSEPWHLTRELVDVAVDVPPALAVAIGRLIAHNELDRIGASFHAWTKQNRSKRESVRRLVARRTTSLWILIRGYQPHRTARRWLLFAVIAGASVPVAIMLWQSMMDTAENKIVRSHLRTTAPPNYVLRSRDAIDDVARTAVHLEEAGTPSDLAYDVVDAAAKRDCTALLIAFNRADAASKPSAPIASIRRRLDEACVLASH